ncbi:MAG: hypothetical protein MUP98_06980 [Candidatus Aminicenantes bacterium]|nr:hypothetical protein [Candidatus Aminicenantes bacterium]
MKKTAFIFVLMFLLVTFSQGADTYIKQVIQNKAFVLEGQEHEAREEIIETWIDKNRLARRGQGRSLIVHLDKKIIYFVDHVQKTYVEMAIPIDVHQYFPEALEQLMGQVTISVSATEELQKFEKRECRVYEVGIGSLMISMKMRVWATLDVPFDRKTYQEETFPEIAKVTYLLTDDAVAELMKIEGFHYRTEMTLHFMGAEMESIQEVVEMTRKSAPDNIYALPRDYTKKDRLSLQDFLF